MGANITGVSVDRKIKASCIALQAMRNCCLTQLTEVKLHQIKMTVALQEYNQHRHVDSSVHSDACHLSH